MKIVLWMDNPVVPTGYASTCRLTARELMRRGHDVYAMCFNGGSQVSEISDWNGIKIIPNYALERDKNAIYGDAETVIRVYRDVKPDILFFHNDSYRYSYLRNIPDEILAKSVFWLPFEGEAEDMQGITLFDRCAATRFVTHHALNIHKGKLKDKDIGYIPHAIGSDRMVPTKDKWQAKKDKQLGIENKFVVCRVDRHQPRKYWDRTIRAFAQFARDKDDVFLLAKCNPRDITMWDESKKEGTDLEALCAQLGVKDKVKFDDFFFDDGYMAHAFYHPSDVFLTTTSGEGFGLTPVEAMACGVPVIYPDTPVLPEVIGDCGIKFKTEGRMYYNPMNVWHNLASVDDAAAKLQWAYDDWKSGGNELKKISDRGVALAAEKYSPKAVYDQWNDVFSAVSEKETMVSVITVLYNLQGEEQIYGDDGIEKFRQTMQQYVKVPYEWIIIDNGSPKREITRKWMNEAAQANRRIRPFYSDVNLGFAGANNIGISKARGKYIVLSNPDSEALDPVKQGQPEDYLSMMSRRARENPRLGVLGMQVNSRNDVMPNAEFPYFCNVLISRPCLDAIKLADDKWFDERFWPAYYEDLDLTIRARSKGFEVMEDNNIPFYHKSGGTNKFAIQGGPSGPYVKDLLAAIEVLEKDFPDMADWKRKRAEVSANGMQGLIEGNIRFLNGKYGMEARKKIKVVWETRIGDCVGFSQIVEGLAPEMEKVGFDVYIKDWANKRNVEDPEILRLIEKYERANVNDELDDAIHIVCWLMETYLNCDADFKIGVSLCESTKVRESYLQACNGMDRILTFSQFCKNVQKNSGYTVPIDVINPGVHPIYINYFERPSREKFTFLTVGVSQERKDTYRTVEAFCECFPKGADKCPNIEDSFPLKPDQIELVVKSNNFGELKSWITPFLSRANIRPIFTGEDARSERKDFSMKEMYDLYCDADCYVHMSHGEGIGMPILEAAATGLPVIFTNWSSPAEYLNESNALPCSLSPYPGTTFTKAYPGAPGDNGVWSNMHVGHYKHLMYQAIRERAQTREKGKRAAELVANKYNWKRTAHDMVPLVFEWERCRAGKSKKARFDPATFVKPALQPIKEGDRVMIDLVTRDRHSYVCSLLTSLLCQTFKNWDIIIECDDSDESMPNDHQIMSMMGRLQHAGHGWRIIRSHRQGPHMAHDRTLHMTADDPRYKYKLICRIDDDIILEPDYLEKLYSMFLADEKCDIAAVSGVYLDPNRSLKDQMAPKGFETDINYACKIEPNVPWPYICPYPPGTPPRPAEHLYSSFMYRVEVGTAIGGYCTKFSQIGHREESDFSYRFCLAGYKQFVHPEAIGYHFTAPRGGIRSEAIQEKNQLAAMDHEIYMKRLRRWQRRAAQKSEASKAAAKKDKDKSKPPKVIVVINGGGSVKTIVSAVDSMRAYSDQIYVTCDPHIGLQVTEACKDKVCAVVCQADDAALLTHGLAATGDHDFVMTVSDTMSFMSNPLDVLDDEHDDFVFEVYKSYVPGRIRKDSSGNSLFVQDDSIGTVVGPEARNQCLIFRKGRRASKQTAKIKYADIMVIDDQKILPVAGQSLRGFDLIPVQDMGRRTWRKICTYQYPEGDLKELRYIDMKPIDEPLVSIIIPTHGRLQHLRRSISSIYSFTNTPFELIVVDNGSSDGTAQYLSEEQRSKSNFRVIRQNVNLGYQRAINLAVTKARGEFLLFFNDDAWIEKSMPDGRDWVGTLLDELKKDPKLGLVGPHGGQSPSLGIDMLYFWCVAMRKSTWKQIGSLDDVTFVNYGGDDDYCMRMMNAGYKVKMHGVFEGILRHRMDLEPPDKKNRELEESRAKLLSKYKKPATV